MSDEQLAIEPSQFQVHMYATEMLMSGALLVDYGADLDNDKVYRVKISFGGIEILGEVEQ